MRGGMMKYFTLAAGAFLMWTAGTPTLLSAQTSERRIEYSEILSNPDDLALSVKYAQQLINEGQLQKATISLERVLLINPEIDKARLLLALVFYRLGSFPEAESELKTLQGRELSAEEQIVVEKYLELIAEKRRLWSASMVASLGIHFDTNKNSNSSASQLRAIDLFFNNNGEDEADFGLITVIGTEYKTKLNPVDPHEVSISTALVFDNQDKLNNIDTLAFAPKIGFATIWRTFELSASTGITNVHVDDVEFMNIYDVKARGSRLFKYKQTPFNIFTEFSGAYEDFQNTARTTTGNESDGYNFGLKSGGSLELTSTIKMASDISFSRKFAKIDFNSFSQLGAGVSLTAPLSNIASASANVNVTRKFFDEPDPFVSSTKTRNETSASAGLTISFGLSKIFDDLNWPGHENFSSGLIGSFGLNYKNNMSNIENFRFENERAQFLITKQVTF